MVRTSYEPLPFAEAAFPIIFHLDDLQHPVEAHWHEGIELLFCLEGTAEVIADTEKLTLRPGELTIINSGTLHYIPHKPGDHCLYYCLIVDPALPEEAGLSGGRLQKQVADPAVEAAYRQAVQELERREPYYKEAAKGAVLLLFSRLYRRWADNTPPTAAHHTQESVKKAILYLKHHFREDLSVDDVCSHVGFSKYYFCRCFRQVTGRSVMEYVQDLRCSHAKKMLEEGACTVSECAALCGFADVSYFTKVFKRQTGRLPSQVKRSRKTEIYK